MNKERMLKWAAYLRRVPREKFDMGTWGAPKTGRMGTQPQCVSRACALGWATSIPEFQAEGLELVAREGSNMADVRFGDVFNQRAAQKFFGITERQSYLLVYDGSEDPREKADEIEEMALGL